MWFIYKVVPDKFDLFLRFRGIKDSALVTQLDEFSENELDWNNCRWYRTHEEERPSRHGSLSRFGTPRGSDGSGSEDELSDGDIEEFPEELEEELPEELPPGAHTAKSPDLSTDERTGENIPSGHSTTLGNIRIMSGSERSCTGEDDEDEDDDEYEENEDNEFDEDDEFAEDDEFDDDEDYDHDHDHYVYRLDSDRSGSDSDNRARADNFVTALLQDLLFQSEGEQARIVAIQTFAQLQNGTIELEEFISRMRALGHIENDDDAEGDSDGNSDFHSQDGDSDEGSDEFHDEDDEIHGPGRATQHLTEVQDYGPGVRRIIGPFSRLTDMKHDALFHADSADPDKDYDSVYKIDPFAARSRLKDWLGVTPNNNELEPRAMRQSIYPLNSQSAYLDWECHDETTLKEITAPGTIYSARHGDKGYDGGLKDPFRPGLTSLDTISFSSVMIDAPSSKFRDGLKVSFVDYKRINQAGAVRKFKNNIAGIITSSDGRDFLVTACESCLVFHEFDPLTQHPQTEVCFAFETKPGFTSAWDRYVSTSPENPHVINYLKVYDNWLGQQVLVACIDDGMVLMWYTSAIIEQVSKHRQRFRGTANLEDMRTTIYSVKIKPDFKIRLRESAWGVDLSTYKDGHGDTHHVVVTSDNSRTITVLYYHVGDEQFYSVASKILSHNIPEVSFVRILYDDGIHSAVVSAASISAELVTMSFMFYLAHGPVSHAHNELSGKTHIANLQPNDRFIGDATAPVTQQIQSKIDRLYLLAIVLVNRTELPEDCWTVKAVDPSCFLPVQSLRAMTGDPSISEEIEITRIMNESRVLNGQCDPVQTSFLGLAAECQFYETPVVNIEGNDSEEHDSDEESAKVCEVDEECRRMHKNVKKFNEEFAETPVESLNGNRYHKLSTFVRTPMLAVTTEHRACLFSSQTLFCSSATRKIFSLSRSRGQVDLPAARLSISHVIPELSCFIVVSQQGLASIFRLCQHRGVYGMRQEHILPSARSLSEIYAGGKNICGLAVRRASAVLEDPRYFIYITYTNGLVISYEIRSESPVSAIDV